MDTKNVIVLVLVLGVVGAGVYLMSQPAAPLALPSGSLPSGDPNRPEASYYIEAGGNAVSAVLTSIGAIIASTGTAANNAGGGSK